MKQKTRDLIDWAVRVKASYTTFTLEEVEEVKKYLDRLDQVSQERTKLKKAIEILKKQIEVFNFIVSNENQKRDIYTVELHYDPPYLTKEEYELLKEVLEEEV